MAAEQLRVLLASKARLEARESSRSREVAKPLSGVVLTLSSVILSVRRVEVDQVQNVTKTPSSLVDDEQEQKIARSGIEISKLHA